MLAFENFTWRLHQLDNETLRFQPRTYNYFALFLLLIPLLTIAGNILVVVAVARERSLRTVTNYFIVSLAIADFLVALVVMPFAVYVEVCIVSWLLLNFRFP